MNIHTIGTILMIVGGIGLILSLFWMMIWRQHASRARYADRGDYGGRNAPPPEAY